jgi:hypothetical protein
MAASAVDAWATRGVCLHQEAATILHGRPLRRQAPRRWIIYGIMTNVATIQRYGTTLWVAGAAILQRLYAKPSSAAETELLVHVAHAAANPDRESYQWTLQGLQCQFERYLTPAAPLYRLQSRLRGALCTEWLPHFYWSALGFITTDGEHRIMAMDFPLWI